MTETRREFAKNRFTVALDAHEAFRAALQDIALFGTGVIATDGKGGVRHVALQEFSEATNKIVEA